MTINLKILDRICLAGVIFVVSAMGYWGFHTHWEKKRTIKRESDLFSQGIRALNRAENNLKEYKTALDSTREQINALHQRIPKDAEIGGFIKQLDSFMKKNEIGLLSVNPMPVKKEKFYLKVPLRLSFKGSFGRVWRLLRDLDTMERTVVMENLVIRKSDTEDDCLVNLTANIFEQQKDRV